MLMPAHLARALLLTGLPLAALQAQAAPWPLLAQSRIPIPMQTAPWPSDPASADRDGLSELIQPVLASDLNLCPAGMRDALMGAGRTPGLLFQRSCNCYAQQRLDGAIEPEAISLCLP
ncbi:MAG: hypothetical protein VKI83_10455 [Synechococcaceae cyanobacterium]|nr:hypothetical protein [Synechococcaceae cyanobacterium]